MSLFTQYLLVQYSRIMATSDVLLALLRAGASHGYDVKRGHDAWFPDSKQLAFGQVYSTLGRLARDGLVEVVETRSGGGPERTVYALTPAGEAHLAAWLSLPEGPAERGTEELVRKTVSALRTGADVKPLVARQRAEHLRRMRELSAAVAPDPLARLARDHVLAHLDADLRWLDEAVERAGAASAEAPRSPSPPDQPEPPAGTPPAPIAAAADSQETT